MNKLFLVVFVFAALQATNCSPAKQFSKRDWENALLTTELPTEHNNIKGTEAYKIEDEEDRPRYNQNDLEDKEEKDEDKIKEKNDDKNEKKEELDQLTYEVSKELKYNNEEDTQESPEYGSGEDIIGGDIKMTPAQTAVFKESGWDALVKSEAWRRNHGVWRRFISYTINNTGTHALASEEKRALASSIKMIQDNTCLRFKRCSTRRVRGDHLHFFNGGGCWSYLGRIGGAQRISLARGCRAAVPAHEIMHALGRFHEQSRSDRDQYVRILLQNVPTRYQGNFRKQVTSDHQNLPYDFLSLMHYGRTAFGSGHTTIQPLNNEMIGQRQQLSMYDIQQINIRYCPERAVRLVGGSAGMHDGRLEMFWNDEWGTVRDNNFDQTDGNVVCKYLGFPGVQNVHPNAEFGEGTGRIWFDNVQCTGNEYGPFSCTKSEIRSPDDNNHENDVGVTCQPNIRLVNGRNHKEGRVEIYINGNWGTVCDDWFGQEEATVVCRQLGYSDGCAKYYHRARFGQGTGAINLDDLRCTGDEQQLSHCRSRTIGEHNCSHREDIGVSCHDN